MSHVLEVELSESQFGIYQRLVEEYGEKRMQLLIEGGVLKQLSDALNNLERKSEDGGGNDDRGIL